MECACKCNSNSMCLSAVYCEIDQQCTLYAASRNEGVLHVMNTDRMMTVIFFENKILTPIDLSNINDTVIGIWNTTVGKDSQDSVPGFSVGSYPPSQGPTKAFDLSNATKYVSFGSCNSTVGATLTQCGADTGLYLILQRDTSLLIAFRFQTPNSYPERHPLIITIEGSNQPSTLLKFGSSWSLIYNGSSGLDVDPGRKNLGQLIKLLDNTISYSSYRLLVQSKRTEGNFVQYSEFQLFVI